MAVVKEYIPLHRLEEQTDQGFRLERVDVMQLEAEQDAARHLHRDDHYIFILQEKGYSQVMVDFAPFTASDHTIFFIRPCQPHQYINWVRDTEGWFLAMDPGLVPDMYRAVLEDPLLLQKPLEIDPELTRLITQCLEVADTIQNQPGSIYSKQVVYSLLKSFVGMMTDVYSKLGDSPEDKQPSRFRTITQDFRKLLSGRYKELKSPGEYASELHLSLSYLNEAVKETTGNTVSYWIQQEIVLEAKRLLYYSSCSVKEIAHVLGYDDHAYFSRLFKKTTGRTPGAFRQSYHR